MSKIEWCDITLNPIVGCSKCSPGCANCYAEKFATRLEKHPNPKIAAKYAGVVDEKGRWTGKLSEEGWDCMEDLIQSPAKRVFLGSMTDIFHENMCQESFNELVDNMTYTYSQHTFLLLTKRPAHALEMVLAYENGSGWARDGLPGHESHRLPKNVWLGVTVCNQEEADEKLPILMKIPAAMRFVSVEPMLGPVDLDCCVFDRHKAIQKLIYGPACLNEEQADFIVDPLIDWVICGGETGPGARPIHSYWVKSLRDQCKNAAVPFFFKSWGEWWPCSQIPDDFDCSKYPVGDIGDDGIFIPPPALEIPLPNGVCSEQTFKVGKKLSGHLIDGEKYREFPEG